MRLATFLLALALAGSALAQDEHPQVRHLKSYRERLALYLAQGQEPNQVVTSMTNYFGWAGARFGADVDRDGTTRYYVAIGTAQYMTFFEILNK